MPNSVLWQSGAISEWRPDGGHLTHGTGGAHSTTGHPQEPQVAPCWHRRPQRGRGVPDTLSLPRSHAWHPTRAGEQLRQRVLVS